MVKFACMNLCLQKRYCNLVVRSQLLEGLKEESQIEDNRKRGGVRARSLTRNTRGVEGHAGTPGLD
jgi:hypothetical protein